MNQTALLVIDVQQAMCAGDGAAFDIDRKRTTDSFHQTDLQALLQARGITDLVVCGLQSEFCIDSTVRRALSLGDQVVLATDAHSTFDNGVLPAAQITAHHNATLANLTSEGRRVTQALAGEVRI